MEHHRSSGEQAWLVKNNARYCVPCKITSSRERERGREKERYREVQKFSLRRKRVWKFCGKLVRETLDRNRERKFRRVNRWENGSTDSTGIRSKLSLENLLFPVRVASLILLQGVCERVLARRPKSRGPDHWLFAVRSWRPDWWKRTQKLGIAEGAGAPVPLYDRPLFHWDPLPYLTAFSSGTRYPLRHFVFRSHVFLCLPAVCI